MDISLIILAFVSVITAIIGSVIPAVPGLAFAYLALWLGRWSGYAHFDNTFMWILAVITAVVFLADYLLPPLITKRSGGTKYATWGSVIGMIAGMIFTPVGMLLGMLLGAFLGELWYAKKTTGAAFKAALGTFVGFLFGTGLKLLLCFYILYKLIAALV